jgi:hypothetical protein
MVIKPDHGITDRQMSVAQPMSLRRQRPGCRLSMNRFRTNSERHSGDQWSTIDQGQLYAKLCICGINPSSR